MYCSDVFIFIMMTVDRQKWRKVMTVKYVSKSNEFFMTYTFCIFTFSTFMH